MLSIPSCHRSSSIVHVIHKSLVILLRLNYYYWALLEILKILKWANSNDLAVSKANRAIEIIALMKLDSA